MPPCETTEPPTLDTLEWQPFEGALWPRCAVLRTHGMNDLCVWQHDAGGYFMALLRGNKPRVTGAGKWVGSKPIEETNAGRPLGALEAQCILIEWMKR